MLSFWIRYLFKWLQARTSISMLKRDISESCTLSLHLQQVVWFVPATFYFSSVSLSSIHQEQFDSITHPWPPNWSVKVAFTNLELYLPYTFRKVGIWGIMGRTEYTTYCLALSKGIFFSLSTFHHICPWCDWGDLF